MNWKFPALVAALGSNHAVLGADISGKVMDKVWRPLAGARVCLGGGKDCTVSGEDGSFRVQGAVRVLRALPVAEAKGQLIRIRHPTGESPVGLELAASNPRDARRWSLRKGHAGLEIQVDILRPGVRGVHVLEWRAGNRRAAAKVMLAD